MTDKLPVPAVWSAFPTSPVQLSLSLLPDHTMLAFPILPTPQYKIYTLKYFTSEPSQSKMNQVMTVRVAYVFLANCNARNSVDTKTVW